MRTLSAAASNDEAPASRSARRRASTIMSMGRSRGPRSRWSSSGRSVSWPTPTITGVRGSRATAGQSMVRAVKAWQVQGHGEPTAALHMVDAELPEPGPGQVRLRVRAAALGFPDVLMCRGIYPLTPSLPFTPGQEVAGDVTAVGDGVDHAVGDRIMAVTAFDTGCGGFAEETLACAGHPIPGSMSDADAAGFSIAYLTGWIGLVTRGQVQRGETLAVLGAAGGCGSAAVQLAKVLGVTVIAVVGGGEKAEYCRTIGADA